MIRDWDLAWIIDVSGLLSICNAIRRLDILDRVFHFSCLFVRNPVVLGGCCMKLWSDSDLTEGAPNAPMVNRSSSGGRAVTILWYQLGIYC